jgi:hypothetical protein
MEAAATPITCWSRTLCPGISRGHLLKWVRLACLAGLLSATGGCALVKGTAGGGVLFFTRGGKARKQQEVAEKRARVQHDVMRAADNYVARVAQASDELALKVGTPQARLDAAQWKLGQGTAAFVTAAGEHPALNAVDMVIIASVSRMMVEDYWVAKQFGDAARPLLATHRLLEADSWKLVADVLTPEQIQNLRDRLARRRQRNPDLHNIGVARSSELLDLALAPTPDATGLNLGGLLSTFGLDPLSRLDPALRTFEQTRQLGERVIYYAQRLPVLLRWQTESFLYRMAEEPESRQILSNANGLTQSAQIFARTTETLPKLVNDQREAAINQVFDRLASERTNLLASLASEEGKVRELLAETRATLTAGGTMATSVNTAILSLDAYTRYVSPPETNAPPPDTNHVPFDVREYGHAAERIGSAARDLNTLLTSAKQAAPQAAGLSQQASADAKAVLNHAFRLALVLILVLAAALLAAGLIYRVLALKLARNCGPTPTPNS